MGRGLILVTGGARSGNSRFAESLLHDCGGGVLYVATAVPFDDEMKTRIKKHQASRPVHWRTLEGYAGVGHLISQTRQPGEAVLLDCLTVTISNLILDSGADFDQLTPETADNIEKSIEAEVNALLDVLQGLDSTAVVVTNEVGLGLVPDSPLGRLFRDVAGRLNQLVAARADGVYLIVCGLAVRLK